MLRRNGPVVKSVESVLRLEGSMTMRLTLQRLEGGGIWTESGNVGVS